MYNGKTISTRGTLQGFDENARAMQKFLMGNPEASEACQEKVRTLVCAMKAANGDSKDVNNCDSAEVVPGPKQSMCLDALEICKSKTMLREQCQAAFKEL